METHRWWQLNILTCVCFSFVYDINVNRNVELSLTRSSTVEEAESSFLESERLLEELHQRSDISQEEKIKTKQEISTGLYRYRSNEKCRNTNI